MEYKRPRVKYSDGKFGFSVQKKIYQSLGGTKEYHREVWEKFADKVGWRKGDELLSYDELTWVKDTSSHCMGHLPVGGVGFEEEHMWSFYNELHFKLIFSLARRLVDCNI
ncbi:MAG: hypothetical protein F6K23_22375 [Okeania sp. SIO2C9]|uniref:GUN4 domain-containing protein n=1 Tax=Okeania sp. SIO2C9 TaxID=2607791 RepID=UPI0013BF8364|nr:GUN4 domain-containing protein [Okeania sp. SIO2C9]NEQ75552.1 hypothetical protein [Okeania sp. SIO2C9]